MTPLITLLALIGVLTIGATFIDLIFASAPRRGKMPYAEERNAHSRLAVLENHRRVTVAKMQRRLRERW